jgi:hypothetical protein
VWLCDLLDSSYLIPLLEAALQNGTVLPGMQTMPSWLEMSSDEAEGRKKALCMCGLMRNRRIFFSRSRVG